MTKLYPIPGFPGYFISHAGNVYSTRTRHSGGALRILKPNRTATGYLRVSLYKADGTHATFTIHRLMGMVVLSPKPTPAHQMRHLDGDKSNNHVNNLAWGTALENAADKHIHGTNAVGERHGSAKLTECDVRDIRAAYATGRFTHTDLAKEYGVNRTTIEDIVKYKTWRHINRACRALAALEGSGES